MAGTRGEEAIVEFHGEIGGRKRVNDSKDIRMAKRGKAEDKEAADCRNLGEVAGDGTQQEEKEDLENRLEKICALLKNNPKRLRNKDVEDLIRHVEVEDIIRLATTIDQTMKGETIIDYGYLEAGSFPPGFGKVARLLRLMLLCGVEKLKPVDLYILYNNFSKEAFAFMLLHALDSYIKHLAGDPDLGAYLKKEETRVTICKLCHVLPWKLFAHVMYDMTSLPVFKFSTAAATSTSEEKENEKEEREKEKEKEKEEEEESDDDDLQKKAAESCEICYGKGKHSGIYGYYCSFWDSVPSGLSVGPSHMIVCRGCSLVQSGKTFVQCCCGSEIGQAMPCSVKWMGF